ncbi:MAG: CHASE4 domain-containing protein [bacterium]
MSLRVKTLLVTSIALLCLIVILYITTRIIIINSFTKLEQQQTQREVERFLNIISNEIVNLDAKAYDWSNWDDTYAFVQHPNQTYIKSNLVDETFTGTKINLMLFFNSSDRLITGKVFDLQNKKEIPIPQSIMKHFQGDSNLLQASKNNGKIVGILMLPEGPMLICSRDILTSADKGPRCGTFVMGRYLDAAEITRLAQTIQLSVTVLPVNNAQGSPDFQIAKVPLIEKNPIFIQPADKKMIYGYGLLRDINKEPALIFRIDLPREIYHRGLESIFIYIFSLIGIGIVFGIITLFLLEKLTLSPVAQLSNTVSSIRASNDLSLRVSPTGKDELGRLAQEFNQMLDHVKQSNEALQKSKATYQALVENINDVIFSLDVQSQITYISPVVERISGYTVNEVMGKPFITFIHPDDIKNVLACFHRIFLGEVVQIEFRLFDKSNIVHHISSSGRRILENNQPIGVLGIMSDITDRKQMEEQLRALSLTDELTGLYNRRGFITLAEQQLKIANRLKQGLCLFYIDVDKMKWINDTLGHKEGDRALIDTASILRTTFRAADIISRIGGDEFVALAIESKEISNEQIMRRLQEHLDAINSFGKTTYQLSLSIGIAQYDAGQPISLESLLEQGDKLMYDQKRIKGTERKQNS